MSPARVIATSVWESGRTCRESTSGSDQDPSGGFLDDPTDQGLLEASVGVWKVVTNVGATYGCYVSQRRSQSMLGLTLCSGPPVWGSDHTSTRASLSCKWCLLSVVAKSAFWSRSTATAVRLLKASFDEENSASVRDKCETFHSARLRMSTTYTDPSYQEMRQVGRSRK